MPGSRNGKNYHHLVIFKYFVHPLNLRIFRNSANLSGSGNVFEFSRNCDLVGDISIWIDNSYSLCRGTPVARLDTFRVLCLSEATRQFAVDPHP